MDEKDVVAESVHVVKEINVPNDIKNGVILTVTRMKKMQKEDFVNEALFRPASHLLSSPGKLIRPGLVFSSAQVLHLDIEHFVDLAVAIEMLHIASLVHDDIVDKDKVRRGRDAVHIKYGTERAILAGDALIAKAIQMASAYGAKVVEKASKAAMDMCAGEMLDFEQQNEGTSMDLNSYLKVAELKTASLIGTASSVVADYTGSNKRNAMYEIGFNMGMSLQLRDDIMNHLGISDTAKKSVGTDAKNARPNIVSVFAAHGKESPVKNAIKLNNFYIDRSYEILNDIENSKLFESYLEFLKIEQ